MHPTYLPTFQNINTATLIPQLTNLLDQNRAELKTLLAKPSLNFDEFILSLEEMSDRLHHFWAPVRHLTSVANTDALREAYNAGLPLLSDYDSELAQNVDLFHALEKLNEHKNTLTPTQQKLLYDHIRDFKLSGIHLPKAKQIELAALKKRLNELHTKFEENVLDATHAWHYLVTDESELAGLTDSAKASAKQAAEQQGKTGWLFTLDAPSYLSVMQHADARDFREKMYHAYNTRASDQGPNAEQFDNAAVMAEILALSQKVAKLLGFKNSAELSLATKMAQSTNAVLKFLNDLLTVSKQSALQEFKALKQFAKERDGLIDLKAWDVAYYSEKLRERDYAISQEVLRQYFPLPVVLKGLFDITQRLFGIRIEPCELETWHPDVKTFVVRDNTGQPIAYFYVDLYARAQKRGGAWMDDATARRKLHNGDIQLPAAYLVCNFTPPVGDQPSLLTHEEVETVFHEFGHSLQHMLTTVEYASLSGINGIPWDAVEVASQFYENWAWEKEGLALISKHIQTGKSLPDEVFQALKRSKHFQSALQMVRQLEFSLFDFLIHMQFDETRDNADSIYKTLSEIRKQTQVIPTPDYQRFPNSFTHIFGGGYAAGYYSYKWAEVMAADAFELFLERGIFDTALAASWRKNILEPGGSEDPAVLFKRFRGREPTVDALLRQSGILETR